MHIVSEEYGVPLQHTPDYVYRIVVNVGGKRLYAEHRVPNFIMDGNRDRPGCHTASKKQVQDLIMWEIQKELFA